jgi:LacI family transcriptional regulator
MTKYTIKDIAKIAGVGVGTVSRVINNNPSVKAATREKVMKVIEELNFKPNSIARDLKRKKHNIIGILINGFHNPFFDEILIEIDKQLKKENFTSLIQYTELDNFEGAISTLINYDVKGIIYLGGKSIDKLEGINIPLVLASTAIDKSDSDKFHIVTINDEIAAYDSIKYLIDTGCKKIGIIVSNFKDELALKRIKGYKKAIKEANLEYKIICEGEYSAKGGYESAKKMCLSERPDGIFAISDLMAIGASRYILENGYKIPDDISIMGFDGIEESEYYYPSITTIKQPRRLMGELATKLLMDDINKKNQKKKEDIRLKVDMIVRESTRKLVK